MFDYRKARRRMYATYAVTIAVLLLAIVIVPRLKPAGDTPAPGGPTAGAPAESAPVESPTAAQPSESAPGGDEGYIEPSPVPAGETRRYAYQNLEIELTHVAADRIETMPDDGGGEWRYTVVTLYPGAALTVISADMSDPAYAEDGLAHPQWGILLDPHDRYKRIDLTDDLEPVEVTPEMRGVFNLEASLFVFRFEFAEE